MAKEHTTVAISKRSLALAKDLCTITGKSSPKELLEEYINVLAKRKKDELTKLVEARRAKILEDVEDQMSIIKGI